MEFQCGVVSDVGTTRKVNQDSACIHIQDSIIGNVELPIVIEGEVDAKELDIDINITNVPLLNTLKVEFEGTK